VSFDFSSDALQEIESFFKRSHKVIVALTVKEILSRGCIKVFGLRLTRVDRFWFQNWRFYASSNENAIVITGNHG
jgi:hypothetical protein